MHASGVFRNLKRGSPGHTFQVYIFKIVQILLKFYYFIKIKISLKFHFIKILKFQFIFTLQISTIFSPPEGQAGTMAP